VRQNLTIALRSFRTPRGVHSKHRGKDTDMANDSTQPNGSQDAGLLSEDDLDMVVGGFGPLIFNAPIGQNTPGQ
jgi:hypothetical protein